jgi:hypothetical protein
VGAFESCEAITRITIGANCNISSYSSDLAIISDFISYYNDTAGKAAGVYTYSGGSWSAQ